MLYNLKDALIINVDRVSPGPFLSDTELSGIRERFHIWSLELVTEAERSREDGETRRGARAIVLLHNRVQYRAHINIYYILLTELGRSVRRNILPEVSVKRLGLYKDRGQNIPPYRPTKLG